MSEKEMEHLQRRARLLDHIGTAISLAAFVGMAAPLLWYIYTNRELVSPSDLPYVVTAAIFLPLLPTGVLCVLLYFLMVRRAYERFNQAFKKNYVLQTIHAMGGFENLSYTPGKGFPYNEVWDSCVVATGDPKYYESEDLLVGTYRGMPFAYCDVITKCLKRSGKKTRIETIFYGQIMRFSLPKGAKWSFGHLQLFEKEFLSNLKGRTAPYKIQVEHEAFNRRFQVFAADEHNAFYLLTPQMLEQIVQFANAADCQIAMTFVGTSLYVAVHNLHSIFDASIKKPLAEQQQAIRAEAELMRRAGELLVLEMDDPSHRNQTSTM